MLGLRARGRPQRGECTVLMITHKFREVMAYADEDGPAPRPAPCTAPSCASTTPHLLAAGDDRRGGRRRVGRGGRGQRRAAPWRPTRTPRSRSRSRVWRRWGPRHAFAVQGLELKVRQGEILGIAGVSGNGQRELVEALVGSARAPLARCVAGEPYAATRHEQNRRLPRALPEEPLRNACVGPLSVAQNMRLRDRPAAAATRLAALAPGARYARGPGSPSTVSRRAARTRRSPACRRQRAARCSRARRATSRYRPIRCSASAVTEIHARLAVGAAARCSAGLDELLELSGPEIAVMSEGRIVFETDATPVPTGVHRCFTGGGGPPPADAA